MLVTPEGELATLDEVAEALAQGAAGMRDVAERLAVLGLALTARQWRGRPPNAQLSAIVQAAERLRSTRMDDVALALALDGALRAANSAMLSGHDLEETIATIYEFE
jgi:hypothetical protein